MIGVIVFVLGLFALNQTKEMRNILHVVDQNWSPKYCHPGRFERYDTADTRIKHAKAASGRKGT